MPFPTHLACEGLHKQARFGEEQGARQYAVR